MFLTNFEEYLSEKSGVFLCAKFQLPSFTFQLFVVTLIEPLTSYFLTSSSQATFWYTKNSQFLIYLKTIRKVKLLYFFCYWFIFGDFLNLSAFKFLLDFNLSIMKFTGFLLGANIQLYSPFNWILQSFYWFEIFSSNLLLLSIWRDATQSYSWKYLNKKLWWLRACVLYLIINYYLLSSGYKKTDPHLQLHQFFQLTTGL